MLRQQLISATFMLRQHLSDKEDSVATLNQLVSQIASLTDIPKVTIFAYGRFAREGGLISQAGRGRGGAQMTSTDAANLLIALGGTDITRDAAKAIQLFRPMRGFVHFPVTSLEPQFRDWLSPFKFSGDRGTLIECDFGTFFDWLISEAGSASLYKLLLNIPLLVISDETYDLMADNYPDTILEKLIEQGLLTPSAATKDQIGLELELRVSFNRSAPSVEISMRRKWNGWEDIFELEFGFLPPRRKYRSEIVTYTKMTEQIIFWIGRSLREDTDNGG